MGDSTEELLNVYDATGAIVGSQPRRAAKRSGLVVGAVNVLLVNRAAEVLLQRRPKDKENGGLWDKSVGGHVSAGEGFDATALRETREELFDSDSSAGVTLLSDQGALRAGARLLGPQPQVLIFQAGLQLNLRDIRITPQGHCLNVLYHVAIYLGRTDTPTPSFRPQASEIAELRYFSAAQVDRLLLDGCLAPNMAYLWLAYGQRALDLARDAS